MNVLSDRAVETRSFAMYFNDLEEIYDAVVKGMGA
jgi:hypothetical protein